VQNISDLFWVAGLGGSTSRSVQSWSEVVLGFQTLKRIACCYNLCLRLWYTLYILFCYRSGVSRIYTYIAKRSRARHRVLLMATTESIRSGGTLSTCFLTSSSLVGFCSLLGFTASPSAFGTLSVAAIAFTFPFSSLTTSIGGSCLGSVRVHHPAGLYQEYLSGSGSLSDSASQFGSYLFRSLSTSASTMSSRSSNSSRWSLALLLLRQLSQTSRPTATAKMKDSEKKFAPSLES
jgi:hypothetical protein